MQTNLRGNNAKIKMKQYLQPILPGNVTYFWEKHNSWLEKCIAGLDHIYWELIGTWKVSRITPYFWGFKSMSISFEFIYISELLKVDQIHLRNVAYLKFPDETFEVCLFWKNRPKILMTNPVLGRYLSNQMFSRMSVPPLDTWL